MLVSPSSILRRCSVPSRAFLLGPLALRGLPLDSACASAVSAGTEKSGEMIRSCGWLLRPVVLGLLAGVAQQLAVDHVGQAAFQAA
jgi:hypothetical protein